MTGDLDVAAVLRRRDAFADDWTDEGQAKWVDGAGIALVRGHGRLTGAERYGHRRGRIDDACSPRGTRSPYDRLRPLLPDIDGLREARAVDQPRRDQRPEASPTASPSSAAASSPPRWRPPTPASAAKVTCSRGGLLARHGAVRRRTGHMRCASWGDGRSTPDDDRRAHATASSSTRRRRAPSLADEVLVATGRMPRTPTSASRRVGLTPGDWLEPTTPCASRLRLALRRRRREPPRAAHPPGQVPGTGGRRRIAARARGTAPSRRAAGAPTSRRPTTRRCRRSSSPIPRSPPSVSPRRRRGRPGYDVRVVDYEWASRRRRRPRRRLPRTAPAWWSTRRAWSWA